MKDKIKKIKNYRIELKYSQLLYSVNIHDNHDKYIKYMINHYKFEKDNDIIFDFTTLPDAVHILSRIDMDKIDILDKKGYNIEHKLNIKRNYDLFGDLSIYREETINSINKLLERHEKISIIKLFTVDKKEHTIESIFYLNL